MRDIRPGTTTKPTALMYGGRGRRVHEQHPGKVDRMVGNRRSHETGHSDPSFLGKAAHAVEHAVEGTVDYISNYSPLSKDLPKSKPKRRK